MPQNFQVLKCYSCYSYQVHPTKKSNKFECKLCGEKQSIKRHYGLGTGKECRIHVQKLNGLRGHMNETSSSLDDVPSDEYEHINENISVNDVKPKKESKWLEYVDNSEADVDMPAEPMFLGDSEVLLKIPKKRRMYNRNNKMMINKNAGTKDFHDDISKQSKKRKSSEGEEENFEASTYTRISKSNVKIEPSLSQLKTVNDGTKNIAKFVPPLINKSSKWAQYAETNEGIDNDKISFDLNEEEINVPQDYSTGQTHEVKLFRTGENNLKDLNNSYNFREDKYSTKKFENIEIPLKDRSLQYLNQERQLLKNIVQPTVSKQSKWAQYNGITQDLQQQNELGSHYRQSKLISSKPQKLFSLCDDSDLDNVLNI